LAKIVPELYPILAVVVYGCQATVNITAWKYKSVFFGVRNNFIEEIRIAHKLGSKITNFPQK
jgi:hypothetical protein